MEKTIGIGYRKYGSNIMKSSNVKAVFKNGKLRTMYPTL